MNLKNADPVFYCERENNDLRLVQDCVAVQLKLSIGKIKPANYRAQLLSSTGIHDYFVRRLCDQE